MLHRVRVAAVGSADEMVRLERAMLNNLNALEEPDDRPPYTLQELHEILTARVVWLQGEDKTFVYNMIAEHPQGSADRGSFTLTQSPAGLWMAAFEYESGDEFSPDDWLSLHKQSGGLPLFAIYASQDYGEQKGAESFLRGEAIEDSSRMTEIWFWLFENYETGRIEEEAVQRLELLDAALREDGWTGTVDALLNSCRDGLNEAAAGAAVEPAAIENAEEAEAEALRRSAAGTFLWETARSARHLACIKYVQDAWQARPTAEKE